MSLYLVRSGQLCRIARAESPLAAAVLALRHQLAEGSDLRLGIVATICLVPETIGQGESIDLHALTEDSHVIHVARLLEATGLNVPEGV